jgi:hypothetical protein
MHGHQTRATQMARFGTGPSISAAAALRCNP